MVSVSEAAEKCDFRVLRSAIQRHAGDRLPFTPVPDCFHPALIVDILRIISWVVVGRRAVACYGVDVNAIEDRRKRLRRS